LEDEGQVQLLGLSEHFYRHVAKEADTIVDIDSSLGGGGTSWWRRSSGDTSWWRQGGGRSSCFELSSCVAVSRFRDEGSIPEVEVLHGSFCVAGSVEGATGVCSVTFILQFTIHGALTPPAHLSC